MHNLKTWVWLSGIFQKLKDINLGEVQAMLWEINIVQVHCATIFHSQAQEQVVGN